MALSDRQLRKDELLLRTISLNKRLKRAMDAFDAGETDAAEDISAYSRTLLAEGRGNMVILRLCREYNLTLPRLAVSAPPVKGKSVFISIGQLPTGEDAEPSGGKGISRILDLRQLTESPAVESNATQRTSNSWSYFANQFGSTWGSHVSTTVPELFSRFAMFGSLGVTLREYVVRQVGWMAEAAVTQSLRSLESDQDFGQYSRPVHFRGLAITHLTVDRANSLSPFNVAPQFSLSEITEPSTILEYDEDGYSFWVGFKGGCLRVEGNMPEGRVGGLLPQITFGSIPGVHVDKSKVIPVKHLSQ